MGEIQTGNSFERNGVRLEELLWRLFDRDGAMRKGARDTLFSISCEIANGGGRSNENPASFEGWDPNRLYKEIAAIVESPAFETEEFLVAFGLYSLLLENNRLSVRLSCSGVVLQPPNHEVTNEAWVQFVWKELHQSDNESTAEISKRIVHSTPCGRTESELKAAEERLLKWMEYFEDPEFKSDFDEYYVVGGILHFSKLPFLKVPEMISVLMGSRIGTHRANDLLIRYGSAARWFASDLLRLVQSSKHEYWIPIEALGAVGRNNPEVVCALLEMIRSDDPKVQERGLATFAEMGPELGDSHTEVLARILELQTRGRIQSKVDALASVGRDHPEIRAMILEAAKPRPPRLVKYKTSNSFYPEATYDAVMHERGPALEAIRYFVDYPNEAIPVLVEALESFEEYDPDWSCLGDCARIAKSFEAFGPLASAVTLRLAEKFRDADRQDANPTKLLRALTAMGPSAAAALPILEWVHREEEGVGEGEFRYPDEFTDPLGWAIYKIKGGV